MLNNYHNDKHEFAFKYNLHRLSTELGVKLMIQNRILRFWIFVLGVFFVILGVVGIFIPLLPTTPFILCAAWCFMKSSTSAYNWLYNKSIFKELLNQWKNNRAISIKNKIISISMILASATYILFNVSHNLVKLFLILLLSIVCIFILRTKSK